MAHFETVTLDRCVPNMTRQSCPSRERVFVKDKTGLIFLLSHLRLEREVSDRSLAQSMLQFVNLVLLEKCSHQIGGSPTNFWQLVCYYDIYMIDSQVLSLYCRRLRNRSRRRTEPGDAASSVQRFFGCQSRWSFQLVRDSPTGPFAW